MYLTDMEIIMQNMWKDFNDFELAELSFQYGLEDNLQLKFNERFVLVNRVEIEHLLTDAEMIAAFGD